MQSLTKNPLKIQNYFFSAEIDSLGIILTVMPDIHILSILSPGKNLFDLIPELEIELVLSEDGYNFITIDRTSYFVYSRPWEDKQGATLSFEPVETTTLNMLLESHYEGIIFVDKKGIIRFINETLSNYLKRPQKTLIGQSFNKFKIDPALNRVIKTQKPEMLSVFLAMGKNGVASRHPIFFKNEFIGVYGRYFSIDGRDLKENTFGDGYLNLLEGLQINNINQAMLELRTYKHEFYEKNTTRFGVENIIGESTSMKELKKRIKMIWDTPSSVLLTGESGTGKELFAQAIHYHSDRFEYPFIKVNCAAIPESLLESELFGYADGAFTGARKGGKIGKFELANKGIIFLDEIGDMPLSMQAKLLRVLQEKEIERVGGEKVIPIDVRVISATNKDLSAMVAEGKFRADLFYRLNVINFYIPPLRERKEDIPDLINYFINTLNEKLHRNIEGMSPKALERMVNYDWPGNIRELINILEAAMNFCRSGVLGTNELPHFLLSEHKEQSSEDDLSLAIEQVKKNEVIFALEKSNGKRSKAASMLGVSKSTLYRLMKKYDLIDFP